MIGYDKAEGGQGERELNDYGKLISFIRQRGARAAAIAVTQIPKQIDEGIDLIGWNVVTAPGAILFTPPDTALFRRILVVNASEAERERWERELAGELSDTTLVLQMAR